MLEKQPPKIGILVVAYNAESTLAKVLDRIPADFRSRISEVLVCDDHSQDSTYLVGLGYKQITPDLPITVMRHPRNLGYGGNQKAGYRMAAEHGMDIVVLLHGDGQYAPECLPDMVEPIVRGECQAVFGSRMMTKGSALKGGMPLYKYLGNKILTKIQNAMLGSSLSEFHSGYRAYHVPTLTALNIDKNSDDFNFDTQIIIQLVDAGKRIIEVPIPTYYGDEICYVNGMKYAKDVLVDVVKYRLRKAGLRRGRETDVPGELPYDRKSQRSGSQAAILRATAATPEGNVLELGCATGYLSQLMRDQGHHVTGVDIRQERGVTQRVDRFFCRSLDGRLPEEVGTGYDVVVAGDVLEHLPEPAEALVGMRRVVRHGGTVLACVPNVSHWYVRVKVATGRFDYDRQGILDRGHLRLFTRRSFGRLAATSGFYVSRVEPVGTPFERIFPSNPRILKLVRAVERLLLQVWPAMFAYQFLFHLHSSPDGAESASATTDVKTRIPDAVNAR